jgi:Spy/CpxP family protein refolding chaperone
MKKSSLFIFLAIAISGNVMANNNIRIQSFSDDGISIICGDSVKQTSTPESKAQKHTDYMAQKLNLSTTQKQQVYNLTLNKVKSMSALKTKYNGDIKAAQPEIAPIRSTYDSKLKTVLTPEQQKQWQLLQEDRKLKSQEPGKMSEYDPTILDSQW